jgi:hypothetical protein
MDQGIKYYIEKMDSHKKTGYLFGVIPFSFKLVKEEAIFLFALLFLSIGVATGFIATSFLFFLMISTEYSRVFDYRDRILEESLINEEMFKIEMGETGIDPNFPHDPLYVTSEDRLGFFRDSLNLNKSFPFPKKLLLFVVSNNVFRS